MKLSHEILAGTWVLAGSEIDHLAAGDEVYRFTPPDVLAMEFKGSPPAKKLRYRLTDEGFVWGPEEAVRCPVTAWLEGGS